MLEQSSGRTLDAPVHIIRSFIERRGLKADQICLQREEVAVKIAELSHKRLEVEKAEIEPIPEG